MTKPKRTKPTRKPRVLWVPELCDGSPSAVSETLKSEAEHFARTFQKTGGYTGRILKFVEVVE